MTLVIAVLLGTVCAVALALSALLARTTTSGVLAYLAVFALTVGTLIVFGLVSAVTTETVTRSSECPSAEDRPPDLPADVRADVLSCTPGSETYGTTRTRTDLTWWLLAPNPFVVLADAAPQLPPLTAAERLEQQRAAARGEFVQDPRDVDPLGQIGRAVRDLRSPPSPTGVGVSSDEESPRGPAVWPTGLAVNALFAVGALLVTVRRLQTPSRRLPRGQRVA